ncbi:hypothetical protein BHE97_07300 [Aeromicrobium sp. PE09-221]|uniref:helix-turn-helix transcriptional regulator n=1 Tax=Aeromicrobium sp. PE09-221 TaxID=1898043 RepID=UPI000B3E9851|nr:helix-turn-helix transcriptional regulator [Aeromicrobium sp. PE09-221]OUZ10555.1 hypothetical protein BHE97_07300 [Aeromicrobium sp. PE09-221]
MDDRLIGPPARRLSREGRRRPRVAFWQAVAMARESIDEWSAFSEQLGRRLAHARAEAGYSQEDVARAIGVTTARYRTLEEGVWTEATRGLRLDTVVLLCRFIGVPAGDLIPGR